MKPLFEQKWIEDAIMERARRQELILALAISLGAKDVVLEWAGPFELRTRFLMATSRRLRRKALKLAIARLAAPEETEK